MSEPLKTQNFVRYGWVTFDSEEHCKNAKEELEKTKFEGYNLQPVKSQTQRKPIRITPPLPDDITDRDLELCRKLVHEVLDPEKKIDFATSALEGACKFLKKQQQLDLYLLYLRRVHALCLYCGEEYDDERMLASKCGPQHLRSAKQLSRDDSDNNLNYMGSKNFEEKYVNAAQTRLRKGPKLVTPPDEDQILKDMKQHYAQSKTVEVAAQKFKCKLCDKMFKGPEFVHKHIFNKHEDALNEKFNKVRYDELMKENYLSDPNKIINQPNTSYYERRDYRRTDYRRREGGRDWERDDRKQKEYVDYDDPQRNVQNPESGR